jgi:hypothetical protein
MLPSLPVYVDRWTRSSRRQFARNVGFNSGKLRRVIRIAELGGEAPTPRLRGGAAPLRRPRGRPGHHVAAKRLINQCRLPNAPACGGAGWALRQLFAFPALVERRPLNVSIGRSDHPVPAASAAAIVCSPAVAAAPGSRALTRFGPPNPGRFGIRSRGSSPELTDQRYAQRCRAVSPDHQRRAFP